MVDIAHGVSGNTPQLHGECKRRPLCGKSSVVQSDRPDPVEDGDIDMTGESSQKPRIQQNHQANVFSTSSVWTLRSDCCVYRRAGHGELWMEHHGDDAFMIGDLQCWPCHRCGPCTGKRSGVLEEAVPGYIQRLAVRSQSTKSQEPPASPWSRARPRVPTVWVIVTTHKMSPWTKPHSNCPRTAAGIARTPLFVSSCLNSVWRRKKKRTTSAGTSVRWVQRLPRRCLGRKAPPLKKDTTIKTSNELKRGSACLYHLRYLYSSPRKRSCGAWREPRQSTLGACTRLGRYLRRNPRHIHNCRWLQHNDNMRELIEVFLRW